MQETMQEQMRRQQGAQPQTAETQPKTSTNSGSKAGGDYIDFEEIK